MTTTQHPSPRPLLGLTREEAEIQALYKPIEDDVARMWTNHSVDGIALELRHKYGPHVTPRLIWSMWQRIKRRS